jgi:hypothetical protein
MRARTLRAEACKAREALQARVTLLEGRLRFVENQLAAPNGGGAGRGAVAPRLAAGARMEWAEAEQQRAQLLGGPAGLLDVLMAPAPEAAAAAAAAAAGPPPSGRRWHAGALPAALPAWQQTAASPGPSLRAPAGAPGPWSPPAPWDAAADGGGLLTAAAAGPRDAEALGGRSPPRPAAQPWAPGGGGGGGAAAAAGPLRARGTEDLVEKLALRHAQAQALLQKMQEARARRF